jgi:hypothetical protein
MCLFLVQAGMVVNQGTEMEQKYVTAVKRDDSGVKGKERRLDLSVPQVAGSALAAVAAAVLASQLDVYGTIIGAGVVSVIATCGGSVFQHFFRRTGEHLRDVADGARPRPRQVPARTRDTAPRQLPGPRDRETRNLRAPWPVREQGAPGNPWAAGGGHGGFPAGTAAAGRAEYGEATTHGTRMRGWKGPVLAAVAVFLVAMAGITGFELIAGHDLSGGKGTTIGSVVSGSGGGSGGRRTPSGNSPGGTPGGTDQDKKGPGSASPNPTPSGSGSPGGGGSPHNPRPSGGSMAPGGAVRPPSHPSATPQQGGATPSAPTPAPSGAPFGGRSAGTDGTGQDDSAG